MLKNIFIIFVSATLSLSAQTLPSAQQGAGNSFLFKNCEIYTISDGVVKNGYLLTQGSRIAKISESLNFSVPKQVTEVDCAGKRLYPGLIDAGNILGLQEIGSQSETQDQDELGNITPQMEALTAVNPNSVIVPVTRVSGVSLSLTIPRGGLFPGRAALVTHLGYTPAQMFTGFKGQVLNFPRTGRNGAFDRRSDEDIEKAAKRAMENLEETWNMAVQYAKIDSAYTANPDPTRRPEFSPEIAALLPAVRGEMTLLIEANAAKDIEKAIEWAKGRNLTKVVLMGVAEGWRVANKIVESGFPVLTGPVIAEPTRASDRFDRAYANAALLQKAGVKVAIRTDDDNANFRHLPFQAGFAVAYGMPYEEALKAITLYPAQIMGVDRDFGSLAEGKSATFFMTNGDPFEPKSLVHEVYINGWKVPMSDRQSELYREFLNRSPGLQMD